MPLSEAIVKDRIKGIVYWNHVSYTRMDQYQSEYRLEFHTIKIIRATAPALIDAARALRTKLEHKGN